MFVTALIKSYRQPSNCALRQTGWGDCRAGPPLKRIRFIGPYWAFRADQNWDLIRLRYP